METAAFDFPLPVELIAQSAIEPRDAARLLVATDTTIVDQHVRDLAPYFQANDLLVLNRTRVIPARLFGNKSTGGAIELMLIHRANPTHEPQEIWRCFIRGKVRPGSTIHLHDIIVTVQDCDDDSGDRLVQFPEDCSVITFADVHGHIPLPPYIRRADTDNDRNRYQTVFGDSPGSVAAPTASLHLTDDLFRQFRERGIQIAYVDLAIGPGTFKPVTTDHIEDYRIHAEYAVCPAETVTAIQACKARGGRVIAVGTTVVRTLESASRQPGGLAAYADWTRLFMHPPQRPVVVDVLMTNFHLPRSSLLMLVACFTGLERLHAIYQHAIAERYRFFSYGDAMLLECKQP